MMRPMIGKRHLIVGKIDGTSEGFAWWAFFDKDSSGVGISSGCSHVCAVYAVRCCHCSSSTYRCKVCSP